VGGLPDHERRAGAAEDKRHERFPGGHLNRQSGPYAVLAQRPLDDVALPAAAGHPDDVGAMQPGQRHRSGGAEVGAGRERQPQLLYAELDDAEPEVR
jgi:hypothetical protein